jgi:hypothetical protein
LLQQRDQYLHVFDTIGRFEYYCTLHPNMVGTVVVTDSTGAAPPTADSGVGTGPAPGSITDNHASEGIGAKPIVVVLLTAVLLWLGAFTLKGAGAQISGKPRSRRVSTN